MEKENPTVSVIVPTYNRADLVGRAIESVLEQTYKDFELIVVDDDSKDNTREIIHEFNDPRIRYICHDKNKGGSAARNTGIDLAKGKYIALLDSDDEWIKEKLGKQVTKLRERSNVGLVSTGAVHFSGDNNGKVLRKDIQQYRGEIFEELLMKGNVVSGGGSSALIKAECFENVGNFDERLKSSQDYDMWIRIAKKYEID